jgi:hypothetical protein
VIETDPNRRAAPPAFSGTGSPPHLEGISHRT